MIGREMPPTYPLPSTDIPPLASAIPGTFRGSRSELGTSTIPPFTNTNPPSITNNNVPSITSAVADDRIRGTATLDDNPDLSLLSLIDLEQAIEHVTELILTPSLLNSGSPSSTLAGVHKCNNSHLLVDGKVQWKKALYFSKLPAPCVSSLVR